MDMASLSVEQILGQFLMPKKKRKADPDYGKFRRLIKKNATTYTIDPHSDTVPWIYIEPFGRFEKGLNFPHYFWGESLDRLEQALDGSWVPEEDGCLWE